MAGVVAGGVQRLWGSILRSNQPINRWWRGLDQSTRNRLTRSAGGIGWGAIIGGAQGAYEGMNDPRAGGMASGVLSGAVRGAVSGGVIGGVGTYAYRGYRARRLRDRRAEAFRNAQNTS